MRPTPLLRSCGPRTLASMAMTAPGQSPSFLPAIAPSPASPPALDLAKLMGDTLLRLIQDRKHGELVDEQGRVGFTEFKGAVTSIGLAASEARRIFDHFDRDGTGYINFADLNTEVRAMHACRLTHAPFIRARAPRVPRPPGSLYALTPVLLPARAADDACHREEVAAPRPAGGPPGCQPVGRTRRGQGHQEDARQGLGLER